MVVVRAGGSLQLCADRVCDGVGVGEKPWIRNDPELWGLKHSMGVGLRKRRQRGQEAAVDCAVPFREGKPP